MEISRVACDKALTELGQTKADTLRINIDRFLKTFSQIKNVDFTHDGDFSNLKAKDFKDSVLIEIKDEVNFVTTTGLGATGGSLAAGGGGMALGTAVLTGVAAGPAILIAGWYMGSKASKNLDDAHSNLAEAKRFSADVDAAIALTDGIRKVADKSTEILSQLRMISDYNVKRLQHVIAEQGTNYGDYDDQAKAVMANVKTTQVIKVVLDTPILDENGALLGDADANLADIELTIGQGLIA